MSCRSTACSSVATSYARAASHLLTDGQVQSLFHSLKRQGKDEGHATPTREEYAEGIDRMLMRLRNDQTLHETSKERLIARLEQARHEPTLEGPAWFAVQQIHAAAQVADSALTGIFEKASLDLDSDPALIRARVAGWMNAAEDDFEDVEVPDPSFRYDLTPGVPTDARTSRALRKLGYEQFLAQQHPVFVYGTLRPGQGNFALMRDAAVASAGATLKGHAIYGAHRGFPYAAEHNDPEAVTVGDLVWLSDSYAGQASRYRMDSLEGFDSDFPSFSHYERVLREVQYTDDSGVPKTVKAWTYMARGSAKRQLQESDRIMDGDWVKAKNAYRQPRPFYGSSF